MKKRVVRSYSFSEQNRKTVSGSFRTPSKRKERNFFWFIIISFFVFIIAILCLLFSKVFYIKDIQIEGLRTINQESIENIINEQKNNKFLMFSQDNLILFNENRLISNLQNFNFMSVNIKKNIFKRSLNIKIEERQQAIIFLEKGVYFFLDKEGNIISYKIDCQVVEIESLNTSTDTNTNNFKEDSILSKLDKNDCIKVDDNYKRENLYPIIENINSDKVDETVKKVDLDDEYIDFCLKLYNKLYENTDFGLKNIILDEERYNTVKIKLNNGLEVYFSLKNDCDEQIKSLFTLEKEMKSELQGKKYIDLRYGDKIFYN